MAADDLHRRLEALLAENQSLSRAVRELSTLNELSVVIGSMLNSNQVMEIVVKRSLQAVNAEQGVITMFDQAAINPLKTLIRAADTSLQRERFHLDQNIAGWMQIHKQPLRSNDLRNDHRFSGVKIAGNIHSILCAPLLVKNKLIGVLSVFNKKAEASQAGFDEQDERLLAIIAGQSAQVIETARLYEAEKAKQDLERELSAAREVQRSLLPQRLPQIRGIELAASSTPAREVGGDYYDVMPLGDDRYGILLADVSGKGLPAALVSTMVKGIFWAQLQQHSSPNAILQATNVLLRNILPRSTFVTAMLAMLDAKQKRLELCSAGQCQPLYFGVKRAPQFLEMSGHPMNWLETPAFDSLSIKLRAGDSLLLYSDGIVEAQNEMDQFYGAPALLALVEKLRAKSALDIHDDIVEAINAFTGQREPADDVTLLVIRAS